MKRVLGLLLVMGIVGCGGLEQLGAEIERNSEGEVVKVDLVGTQVTDAGLVHLRSLSNLTMLSLEDTNVTDAGVAELKKVLPTCQINK